MGLKERNYYISKFNEVHGDKYDYSRFTGEENRNNKIEIICKEHGSFLQTKPSHQNGNGCPKCAPNKNVLVEDIIKVLNDKGLYWFDGNYLSGSTRNIECVDSEGYMYTISYSNIKKYGVRRFEKGNPYTIKNIELYCNLNEINVEFNDDEYISEKHKHSWKCSDCGSIFKMPFDSLKRKGLLCKKCSDGLPSTEKFLYFILKELGIDFEFQKMFRVGNRRYYDFYIKQLNLIIELHGQQHYVNVAHMHDLEFQENNDKEKRDVALNMGINYIEIDCSHSSFEWMNGVFIDSLSDYIDFSKLDMRKIFDDSKKSIMIMVCDYWNNKSELETTTSLVKIFKLSNVTISKYLKRGTGLGICNYDSAVEKSITSRRNVESMINRRKVIMCDLEFNELRLFDSIKEASIHIGCHHTAICNVLSGKAKTASGHKWKYADMTRQLT